MKTLSIFMLLFILSSGLVFSQVAIKMDGSAPDASAILDLATTEKGFLLPRMTTVERNAIESPAEGLLIFNLTTGCIDYFLGGSWKSFCGVSEPVFQCGMKMTDSRDGKKYNTVKIGTQCWMAQNLNIGVYINGSAEQLDNDIIEKYCYNDVELNCDFYGGLYQWAELIQYINDATNTTSWDPVPTGNVQGICPAGWHFPTDAEWTALTTFLGGTSIAGGKMKEAGYAHWASPNTGATNSSGFTALPVGYWEPSDGNFYGLSTTTSFWSTSQEDASNAWRRDLYHAGESLEGNYILKAYGFSARCIQD